MLLALVFLSTNKFGGLKKKTYLCAMNEEKRYRISFDFPKLTEKQTKCFVYFLVALFGLLVLSYLFTFVEEVVWLFLDVL